jgi:glutathione S-transferase
MPDASAAARVCTPNHITKHTRAQGKAFAGGEEPHLGDLAVFGCLRAIEGLDTHSEALRDQPDIAAWYERMMDVLNYGPM